MLLLTRRIGESLYIGNARVTVTGVHGGVVRLGIEAPQEVRILREELLPRDQATPEQTKGGDA